MLHNIGFDIRDPKVGLCFCGTPLVLARQVGTCRTHTDERCQNASNRHCRDAEAAVRSYKTTLDSVSEQHSDLRAFVRGVKAGFLTAYAR